MKKIGQGTFTTCYQASDNKVLLVSSDPVKEVMSCGWFPSSRLFPKVTKVDSTATHNYYEMKYYPKVTSLKNTLDTNNYNLYKELRALSVELSMNIYDGYQNTYKAFTKIKTLRLREAMLGALDACSHCGSDIGFEISPRNVAVSNGKLILLDCFFMKGKLLEVKNAKKAIAYY